MRRYLKKQTPCTNQKKAHGNRKKIKIPVQKNNGQKKYCQSQPGPFNHVNDDIVAALSKFDLERGNVTLQRRSKNSLQIRFDHHDGPSCKTKAAGNLKENGKKVFNTKEDGARFNFSSQFADTYGALRADARSFVAHFSGTTQILFRTKRRRDTQFGAQFRPQQSPPPCSRQTGLNWLTPLLVDPACP